MELSESTVHLITETKPLGFHTVPESPLFSADTVKINAEIQRSNRVLHGGFETPERPFQLCRSRFFRPLGFHTVPESPLFSADTVKINAEIQRSNRGLRVTANAGLPTPSFCCQGRRRFAKKRPLGFDPMPESRGVF
jgi:hypothetical protein